MSKATRLNEAVLFAFALSWMRLVSAQENCIAIETTAEIEQTYLDERGEMAIRLTPIRKVAPGDQVVWTITAKNVCDRPAENIVIANPVPEHMTYVAGSAMGVGATITYSLDQQEFKDAAELTVSEAGGAVRTARPDEYRAIRWSYASPFAPGATAFVRYRAVVK